jgi:hypothetical protein
LSNGFYFLATDEDMELGCLSQGRVSENPSHNRFWYNEDL